MQRGRANGSPGRILSPRPHPHWNGCSVRTHFELSAKTFSAMFGGTGSYDDGSIV
jgi:hypothetical protein